MTNEPVPVNPDEIGAIIQRIHQLGSSTETIFSRLYASLIKRNQLAGRESAVAEITEQIQLIARRNRHLRQLVEDRDIEVERLHGILASISEGIIMHDTEGRIIMMNEVASQLLGSESLFWESELGTFFEEHKTRDPIGSELALLGEARRVTVGERVVGAQIIAIHDNDNIRVGTLMIVRDVTADDLSTRMKKSFVTHISHELITPLAPMRVASEILLNSPDDQPPNRRMLTMISRNIDILDRMVRELLDMSAMTSGDFHVQKEPLSLEKLIWDVVHDYSGDIREANLDITVMLRDTETLTIDGDEKYLTWAVGNLVRNAIQYNQPNEHIVITAALNRNNSEELVLKVIDTGVGISQDDKPSIFNLFFRGEPRTQEGKRLDPRGLGQGLFVAQTVTRAHGGQLQVESELHQGSTFVMSLPRSQVKSLPEAV